MSIFSKVFNFIKNVGGHVHDGFVSLFGQDLGEKLIATAEEFGKTQLGVFAMSVVQGLEDASTSGDQKRAAAINQIGTHLASQGHALPQAALGLVVELALQIVRGGVNAAAIKVQ